VKEMDIRYSVNWRCES